jgi:AcrR family transcriptional regulator
MDSRKMARKRTKAEAMSGNGSAPRVKIDRRVARTRDILGDALVALIHEKAFEEITVQEVLDRAGVSRSTFYTHYKDKNDLFLSDAEEFFEAMSTALSRYGDQSNRVAPVREFFEHVADFHKFRAALMAAGKFQDILEMGQEFFARGIAQRLAELRGPRPMTAARRAALAHAFAGALFSLLSWWIHGGGPCTAAQMDELYHQMVWSSIGLRAVPPTGQPREVRYFDLKGAVPVQRKKAASAVRSQ